MYKEKFTMITEEMNIRMDSIIQIMIQQIIVTCYPYVFPCSNA